jgi:hypothetical protein
MNIRKLLVIGGLVFIALATVIIAGCTPTALTSSFSYQGVLTDGSGNPVSDGDYEVAFRLYRAGTGTEVYVVTRTVTTQNGIFSEVLSPPIEEMHEPMEVDLTVEGEHLPNRQRLWGAPYAMSLVPGATIDGYVYKTSPMSATLNIANAGDGIGLGVAVVPSSGDSGNAILAVNNGADVPTLELANLDPDGDYIYAYRGDGVSDPFNERVFRVYDYLDTVRARVDGTFENGGADYADMLPTGESAEPGDVLVIGTDGLLIRSAESYATNVAGVYSTRPGFLGGDVIPEILEGDPNIPEIEHLPKFMYDLELDHVPVAMAGVVPCKVSAENGAIQPGDLLVTSDTTGHAMRADPLQVGDVEFYPPGTILGKAMESLDQGTGVILILVSLN